MAKDDYNARYRAAHRDELQAKWNEWRKRNAEYMRLRKRITRRIMNGQDVPPEDAVLLAQLRANMTGHAKKAREQVGTAAQRDAKKRVKVWEGHAIPVPKYEGEKWIRMRMDDGEVCAVEWVAVRCRVCKALAWTYRDNGDICFECLIHRCATDLRKWIDGRLKIAEARLGRQDANKA